MEKEFELLLNHIDSIYDMFHMNIEIIKDFEKRITALEKDRLPY